MKFRTLLMAMAVIVMLGMLVPVASAQDASVQSVTYSCAGPNNAVTVQLPNGEKHALYGVACTDEGVMEAVARRFQQDGTVLQVSRVESFSQNPGAWFGINWLRVLLYAVGIVFSCIMLFTNIFVVRQQTVYIIERLGKFARIARPGLNFKLPFLETVVAEFNLRQQQESVEVDTKTADNVFLGIDLAVQFSIVDPQKAFYELADFALQLKSYVFDEVRSAIPGMKFDEVFQSKEHLADRVRTALAEKMSSFGYKIIDVLVTDITPPEEIENAMNQVITQQRLREAATEKGEADKVLIVKAAEAQRDRDKLHGEGIAAFRKAVAHGIKESMGEVKEGAPDLTDEKVSALLLTTQYYDTMKDVAGKSNSNTIFMPSSPTSGQEVFTQMTAALSANSHGKNGHDKTVPPAAPAAPVAS